MWRYLLCLLIGHDTGRVWYWDATRRQRFRDWRYCERCGRHL